MPLAWVRPDPRAPLLPVWRTSVLLVLLGGGLCAWFFARIEDDPITLLLLGLSSVAAGMLRMVRAALKSLGDERCVSVFKEGVVVRDHLAARAQVSWAEIAEVSCVEEGERLVITRRGSGAESPELIIQMTFMPLKAEALKALLIECVRRDGLGVALKVEEQLERLGVQVGLPSDPRQ